MSTESETPTGEEFDNSPLPDIAIPKPKNRLDWATIIGLTSAVGMIFVAIWIGQSKANFFNLPSFLIVILGTIAATAVSFSSKEFAKSGSVLGKSIFQRIRNPIKLCESMIAMSVVAKKKGILALSNYDKEMQKYPFLARSMQLVIDGYQPEDIERIMTLEIEAIKDRHKRTAAIAQRASEVAPAMGLIGTLVGLVQMLAELENPETIGPAMAVALLTTFYGAILGTVIMGPLAVKLDKNSHDEALVKTLVKTAAMSVARQENPRRLEMLLNADLPPHEQVHYFD